ncbi:MAG TPA: two-component system response regulator CreB [Verrucomicrobia bacterium]|nr:two-component system response regulator CreB [Verrucomicrobiota bacterium]
MFFVFLFRMKLPFILLVDDEQHIADVVIYMLKEHGFNVAHAANGDAGLQCFKDIQPTLVLLDLNLPGLPGLELFGEIKKIRPETPVIMLTCRGEEADRVLGLEMGADDYISKPFSARELVARVKGVLRRARITQAAATLLKYGPLECDVSAVVIRCSGQPVLLTHFEFEVMKTLLKSPGRAFSRDALIRAVYEEGHPVNDRAIDACIKRIRRKFMAIRSELDPIATLYGIGYKLNPALENDPS